MARALIVNGRMTNENQNIIKKIYEAFQLKVGEFKTPFFFVSFCRNDGSSYCILIAIVVVFVFLNFDKF